MFFYVVDDDDDPSVCYRPGDSDLKSPFSPAFPISPRAVLLSAKSRMYTVSVFNWNARKAQLNTAETWRQVAYRARLEGDFARMIPPGLAVARGQRIEKRKADT